MTKYQFLSPFSTASYKPIRPVTIVNGFRKVGVCPFDSLPSVFHMFQHARIQVILALIMNVMIMLVLICLLNVN